LPARCAKFLKTSTRSAGIPSSVPSKSALSQVQGVTTLCIAPSTKEIRPFTQDSVSAVNVRKNGRNSNFGNGEVVIHELTAKANIREE